MILTTPASILLLLIQSIDNKVDCFNICLAQHALVPMGGTVVLIESIEAQNDIDGSFTCRRHLKPLLINGIFFERLDLGGGDVL